MCSKDVEALGWKMLQRLERIIKLHSNKMPFPAPNHSYIVFFCVCENGFVFLIIR